MKQKIIVIVGPTASGKSALGVDLARRFNGEVISADSRQVYKGLNIGTGKLTKREMRGIPHHLLDIASSTEAFSAGDYVQIGRKTLGDMSKRGKLPIIVGGTGFYIDALLGRVSLPNVPPDMKLRAMLSKKSTVQLFAILRKADSRRAKLMDTPSERNNKVRLVRAIEIAHSSGSTTALPRGPLGYDVLWIGIIPSDAELKKRINTRLRQRIRAGMVKEAQELHRAGLSYKRMRELGLEYRALARHLQGEITLAEMEKELQSDIWRYARKQIGYWKRNKNIAWSDSKSKRVQSLVTKWLQR